MKPDQRAEVTRLAIEAGVPSEFFEGWVEGEELGLYREPIIGSAAVAASKQAGAPSWALDLGARTHHLTEDQAKTLTTKLKAAGIAFATFRPTHDYLQRKGEE